MSHLLPRRVPSGARPRPLSPRRFPPVGWGRRRLPGLLPWRSQPKALCPTQTGVDALIGQATNAAKLLSVASSPLLPECSPGHALSDIPDGYPGFPHTAQGAVP
jgi:hypothetical protein